MQIINNNLDAVDKLAKIRARLDLLEDDNADRHGADRGYAIEDIERILNGEEPMSTKENQKS
jgi:hypothetical protein